MNESAENPPEAGGDRPLTFEHVLAQLFETVAVTQAQNDVLLGLVTGLVSSIEEIDEQEVIENAGDSFRKHYERRIEQMKSEHTFFGATPDSSTPEE